VKLFRDIGARIAAVWSALWSGYPSGGYAAPSPGEPFVYGIDMASRPPETRVELFASDAGGRELRVELVGRYLSPGNIDALFAGFDASRVGYLETGVTLSAGDTAVISVARVISVEEVHRLRDMVKRCAPSLGGVVVMHDGMRLDGKIEAERIVESKLGGAAEASEP
jgi:hypothetical protein